jgi:hypothetical protein
MQGQGHAKRQKHGADAVAGCTTWPTKAIPSLDPGLQHFSWPYGPAALIEERGVVARILKTAHTIRMPALKWPGHASCYSHEGVGLLGMRMSSDDAFVATPAKRNELVDRAHHYFNCEWKMEVRALSTGSIAQPEEARDSMRLLHYNLTEEHLYDVVDHIDQLHSMHMSLKPETRDLLARCRTANEVKRAMVAPSDPAAFWS